MECSKRPHATKARDRPLPQRPAGKSFALLAPPSAAYANWVSAVSVMGRMVRLHTSGTPSLAACDAPSHPECTAPAAAEDGRLRWVEPGGRDPHRLVCPRRNSARRQSHPSSGRACKCTQSPCCHRDWGGHGQCTTWTGQRTLNILTGTVTCSKCQLFLEEHVSRKI